MTTQLHPYVVHFSVALIPLSVILFWLGTGLTYDRALGVDRAWPADTGRCFEVERSPDRRA